MAERITPREKDYSQWYNDIVIHAKLADQAPVKGCMVIRPNGYAIWEGIQRELDKRFKETGHVNAYFPLLIPESFIKREKEHVEGFAPELAVVTHGGGKKLEEPLVIRPTSETIINAMYSKWIKSYRDLPVLINQWANVVRWEMRTRPFIRTLEFLWQEGHTCHETEEEARRETLKMLDIYRNFIEKTLAIPTVPGEKTPTEKFAGAMQTYTIELMMQDKKALQACTSHYFGTKFAKAFNIQFQNRKGKLEYVHQTSWGITTRMIGALIMTHSDDNGLVLPPKIAPFPVIILPFLKKNKDNSAVLEAAEKIQKAIGAKAKLDDRLEHSFGYKINEWEVQGAPLRVELGPRDLEAGTVVLAPRIGEKVTVKLDEVVAEVEKQLERLQKELFARAKNRLTENTFNEDSYDSFKKRVNEGFFSMHWCGKATCELAVKEETKATIRCVTFDRVREKGKCIYCQGPSGGRVIFAKSY